MLKISRRGILKGMGALFGTVVAGVSVADPVPPKTIFDTTPTKPVKRIHDIIPVVNKVNTGKGILLAYNKDQWSMTVERVHAHCNMRKPTGGYGRMYDIESNIVNVTDELVVVEINPIKHTYVGINPHVLMSDLVLDQRNKTILKYRYDSLINTSYDDVIKNITLCKEIKMIKIYGKEGCKFCVKAKELVEEQGMNHKYYNVGYGDDDTTPDELFDKCAPERPTTVPVIFIDGVFIGGYDQLVNAIG